MRSASCRLQPPKYFVASGFPPSPRSGGPAVASAEAGQPEGCGCRATMRRPDRAAPALAVRGRLPRSGKPSRLVPSLRSLPRRVGRRVGDRCQAHRCAGGGVGSTRITETELAARNRRAGFPAPLRFADQGRSGDSAARGPLQTAAAAQHRHAAGGRHLCDQRAAGFSPPRFFVASGFSRKDVAVARPCAALIAPRRRWPSAAASAVRKTVAARTLAALAAAASRDACGRQMSGAQMRRW